MRYLIYRNHKKNNVHCNFLFRLYINIIIIRINIYLNIEKLDLNICLVFEQ